MTARDRDGPLDAPHDAQLDAQLDAWIDAGTAQLGIPVQPAWCAAIRLHLKITLGHARTVQTFALPDEADPAPVFHA
jgi:1-carboxybiuret hydrolase subunit AtzG-like